VTSEGSPKTSQAILQAGSLRSRLARIQGTSAYAGVSVPSPGLKWRKEGLEEKRVGFILSLTLRGQSATVNHEIPTVV
jgi:hypothetical protein